MQENVNNMNYQSKIGNSMMSAIGGGADEELKPRSYTY
jgi:hypothetical protein